MRQTLTTRYDPRPGVLVATLSHEYPRGFEVPEHAHGSDQVIYAIRGIMHISAEQRFWIVPPQFALWVPALIPHRIRIPKSASMRTLYIRRRLVSRAFRGCRIIHANPFFRELILRSVADGCLYANNSAHRALKTLIVSELCTSPGIPMCIPFPKDERALQVAQTLIEQMAERPALTRICADTGASVRTVERIFQRELGMTVEVWRRQMRLIKSIELLAGNSSIKEAAFGVGYGQPSAFVESFRRTFGMTPKRWTAEHFQPFGKPKVRREGTGRC
jgi:AraC-like DNA-binding protein